MNENRDRDSALKNIDADLKKINQTMTVLGKVIDKGIRDLSEAFREFSEAQQKSMERHAADRRASLHSDQGRDESVDNDGSSFSDGKRADD